MRSPSRRTWHRFRRPFHFSQELLSFNGTINAAALGHVCSMGLGSIGPLSSNPSLSFLLDLGLVRELSLQGEGFWTYSIVPLAVEVVAGEV